MDTVILVDAAFVLKRFRRVYPTLDAQSPEIVADTLYTMSMLHVTYVELLNCADVCLRLPTLSEDVTVSKYTATR